ncbi:AraC family transcriptional regulator [Paenibacillus planticolens]|nr:helix-turn-helix domain-containing protein [Paenibacillus planticolens]
MRNIIGKSYLRIFFYLAAFFTVIIIPFSYFLTNQYSKQALTEINDFISEKTDSLSQSFDYMLDNLQSYGLTMSQDPYISSWLKEDSETEDPLIAKEALSSLMNFMSLQPFISATYLVNMETGNVLDSVEGIHSLAEFKDRELINNAIRHRPAFLAFHRFEYDGRSLLALVIPSAQLKENRGYLVMVLDRSLLQKYLLQNRNNGNTEFSILDEQHSIVVGDVPSEFDHAAMNRIAEESAEQFTVKIKGNVYLIHHKKIQTENWQLYSIVKLKDVSGRVDRFQSKILLSCLILLILLFIGAFWNSKRSMGRFSVLAKQLQNLFGTRLQYANRAPFEEFTIIKSGLDYMMNNLEEMNSSRRNYQGLIKAEYLRHWILHGSISDAMRTELSYMTEIANNTDLNLAVFRLTGYSLFCEKYDYGSRKLLKYSIGNITQEIFMNGGYLCEPVDLGSDHLVLLFGCDTAKDSILGLLHEAAKQIGNWLGIQVVMAIGEQGAIRENLRTVYDRIYDLTFMNFLSGESKIYMQEDYDQLVKGHIVTLDESLIQEVIGLVKSGDRDRTHKVVERLFGQLQTLPYAECKVYLNIMLFRIVKAFSKVMDENDIKEGNQFLEKFDSLTEIKQWMLTEMDQIIDLAQAQTTGGRKNELAPEIADYVDLHLHDSMLTVEEIAEHLGYSGGYIRQIFKDTYQITLSDFILQKRVDRVKELLVTSDMPIIDIAERSGFQSRTTFFTAFKRVTQMTPSQYREQTTSTNDKEITNGQA